jgi:hypothetical protein
LDGEDGKEKAVLAHSIDTTNYKLLKSDTFFGFPKLQKISVGWDAALERICTYALLDLKSQKSLGIQHPL